MRRWTASEEDALRQLIAQCQKYQSQHEILAKGKNKWRILLAVLIAAFSAAAGVVNFATEDGSSTTRPGLKYGVGAVNCITAGITWVSSKLDMGKRVEAHKSASKSYNGLIRNINLELSTPRRDRTVSGTNFLHICMEQMNKILEEAPAVEDDTITAKMQLS